MEPSHEDLNALLRQIQQMRLELDRLRSEVVQNQSRVSSLECELRKTALWRAMTAEEELERA